MKKTFLFLFILTTELTFAQSTEILPGLILPQITTPQRIAMVSSTNGTLVFDKTTQSYWCRQSDSWAELPKAGSTSNYWQMAGVAGNEIRHTNTGGFWSKNPTMVSFFASDQSNPPTAPVNEIGTRLMWIPNRSAFRVGTVMDTKVWAPDSIGLFSFAAGLHVQASGRNTIVMGLNSYGKGEGSVVFGRDNLASGSNSRVLGTQNIASGIGATTLGDLNSAPGNYSTTIGYQNNANKTFAIAIGTQTIANDSASLAMGYGTVAGGKFSTAMGYNTIAGGDYSTVMGGENISAGPYSTVMGLSSSTGDSVAIAMGYKTTSNGKFATEMGYRTAASGNQSTAMGSWMNTNNRKGAFMIGDSDPANEGETKVGVADQLVARFKNGYYLLTSGDINRTGAYMLGGQTAWNAISDSARKERFVAANGEDFLSKLKSLRLGSWNYKNQKTAKPERFYGPMAQEIFDAFGKDKYGTIGTDTTVSTINLDGLLFIFAQALEKRTADLQKQTRDLQKQTTELQKYTLSLQIDNQRLNSENQALQSTIELSENRLTIENEKLKDIIGKRDARLENLESARAVPLPVTSSNK